MSKIDTGILIEALTTIANCDSVKQKIEPNVAEPMELKDWMVRRCLYALVLFEDELERQANKEENGEERAL